MALAKHVDSGEYGLGNSSRTLTPRPRNPERNGPAGMCRHPRGRHRTIPGLVRSISATAGSDGCTTITSATVSRAPASADLWITSIVTVGNYDYGVNWIFREDGSIQVEAMLTGILLPKGSATQTCSACGRAAGSAGEGAGDERYGTLIAPGTVAPNHQHWFKLASTLMSMDPATACSK